MDDLVQSRDGSPSEADNALIYPLARAGERPERRIPRAPEAGLARSLERRRLQAYIGMLIVDMLVLNASFAGCALIYLGGTGSAAAVQDGLLPGHLLLPIYLTIALFNGSYSRSCLVDWVCASKKAILALVVSGFVLNFLAFFAKMNEQFSRLIFLVAFVTTGVLFVVFRIALARFLISRWGPTAVNTLVIGAGGPPFRLYHAYHVDAHEHALRPDVGDPVALDRLAKYLRNMDRVIVSCPSETRHAWAEVLKGSGIQGEIVDRLTYEIGALGVEHHDGAGMSSLRVSIGHLGMRARGTKRLFDLGLTIPALIVLSPLLALCAVLIKLEDGGPILFRQRRMGRGNRFFDIYKFRSMREADEDGERSASRDDERITRIGRFMRRTSIDELPQLINVLLGDMSLVGPRPHALGSQAGSKLFWQVDRKYWQRHSLRPGITGLAQVRGLRGATDTERDLSERLGADLEYLRQWSIWQDILILFATVRVLVHDRAF
ncbi:sugar transferase [Aurantiacibacter spongiae]|uniref:Sugar transferase n=1 Tax=Aurantiacibacter spongiae TaxID=2488860 RepID=A0A3N5CQT3_9SPHN|nr:sugar transferase [Aurantiacibacter spongiae]RPF71443.1 sugar transferase [Aurantiacibacter spongiae]